MSFKNLIVRSKLILSVILTSIHSLWESSNMKRFSPRKDLHNQYVHNLLAIAFIAPIPWWTSWSISNNLDRNLDDIITLETHSTQLPLTDYSFILFRKGLNSSELSKLFRTSYITVPFKETSPISLFYREPLFTFSIVKIYGISGESNLTSKGSRIRASAFWSLLSSQNFISYWYAPSWYMCIYWLICHY